MTFLERIPSRLRLVAGLTVGLLGISGLVGCGSGSKSSSSSTSVPTGSRTIDQPGWTIDSPAYVQSTKKWTVLVYVNAANDLEEFGTLNVNQMEQIGSTGDVNVIVQFKRIKGRYDTSDGDWGGTRRYYVTRDADSSHVSSPILSEQSALDMGNPQSLQDFIQWGISTYPASHYSLVVWNHGAGWRSQKLPSSKTLSTATGRGVSYDDESGNHIDTIQLPAAIDLGSGRKWDLLAFDASLMQMAEVAYEIRDKATYIVGSEESPPGSGYPYDAILGQLTGTPDMDGKALGIIIAQQMLAANGSDSDITQSVLDTSKLAAIPATLDTLGSSLYAVRGTYGTAIADARAASENYAYPENHDLLDFLQYLSTADAYTNQVVANDSGVSSAITQVRNAVNAALVFNNNGTGHPHSNGLAIFLPTPSQYRNIDVEQADGFGQRYSLLAFARAAPNWQAFLANSTQ